MQACACGEGAGDPAVAPALPHPEWVGSVDSHVRGFHGPNQRTGLEAQGSFAGAAQTQQVPSEKDDGVPLGRGASSSWFSQNCLVLRGKSCIFTLGKTERPGHQWPGPVHPERSL